jgi:phthiodiolone/phenolphthiodiolone dimycocerosates ketoreductase
MDYPVLANMSAVQPSLRRGLAANVPFVRILRQLRRL